MYLVTPEQMRILEDRAEQCGVTRGALMGNAGTALAKFIMENVPDLTGGVVILCGSGNNGGDGLAAARLLSEAGIKTYAVLMSGEPTTELSMKCYWELGDSYAEVLNLEDNIEKVFELMGKAAVITDCVYGTGFRGDLPPTIRACFSFASRCSGVKIAADCPSGGDCLTGATDDGALVCDYTLTFGCQKTGLVKAPLNGYCGEITIADIGIPPECFQGLEGLIAYPDEKEIEELILIRPKDSHKGMFGRILNIAGSEKMPGACALSTLAALRSGAGLMVTATVKSAAQSLSSNIFESMYLPLEANADGMISRSNIEAILEEVKKASVIMLGCGLGVSDDTKEIVRAVIENAECPVILDADGINCIADGIDIIRNKKAGLILTPHPGELSRLTGIPIDEIIKNRMEHAVSFAKEYGVTVVSKGAPTYTASSDGSCWINSTGNPGLSRGGSGDILTGIIAGLRAQGLSDEEAAFAGAYLHGKAADNTAMKRSTLGMLPQDVIEELTYLFRDMNR